MRSKTFHTVSLVVTVCIAFAIAMYGKAQCIERLGDAGQKDTFQQAVVADVGTTTKSPISTTHPLVKFKLGNWVITCRTDDNAARQLVAGRSVEIRQNGKRLRIRTSTANFQLPIICIENVSYVE